MEIIDGLISALLLMQLNLVEKFLLALPRPQPSFILSPLALGRRGGLLVGSERKEHGNDVATSAISKTDKISSTLLSLKSASYLYHNFLTSKETL